MFVILLLREITHLQLCQTQNDKNSLMTLYCMLYSVFFLNFTMFLA